MSQIVELQDADFGVDPDAPPGFCSAKDKHQFTLLFAIAVGAVFLLQMTLPQVLVRYFMPSMPNVFGGMTVQVPHSGRAFRWNHELWVPVERVEMGRQPQTVLKVLDDDGRWIDDRDIVLNASAERYLPDDDKLWMVNANFVSVLQNGQTTTLYPRRRLTDVKTAFLHGGEVCALDRQADGAVHWLAYREGEWADLGSFHSPSAARPPTGAPGAPLGYWPTESLQTVDDQGVLRVVFRASNSNGVSNRFWSASLTALLAAEPALVEDSPVSAHRAENVDPVSSDALWTDLGAADCQDWKVVTIDGRPALLHRAAAPFQSRLSVHWLDELDQPPFAETNAVILQEIGVAIGVDEATVVADTFPPGGCRLLHLTAHGFDKTAGVGIGSFGMAGSFAESLIQLQIWSGAITYGLTISLIVFGHVLMKRHRDLRYGFGHDVVRLGSLPRRSIARIVDIAICTVPLAVAGGLAVKEYGSLDLDKLIDAFVADWKRALAVALMIILGSLLYSLVTMILLGTLQGWYGWTPGKLLCGLRVCRSNLQKCGTLRGIVREFLLIVDQFGTYLVGIAMIGLMPNCQRLGDLAMDTIVVEASSLPEAQG